MPAYQYDPYMDRFHVNKGRQHFLENHPDNFSEIIHDYSEERKGFVLWRDLLEERLVCDEQAWHLLPHIA